MLMPSIGNNVTPQIVGIRTGAGAEPVARADRRGIWIGLDSKVAASRRQLGGARPMERLRGLDFWRAREFDPAWIG